MDEMRCTKLNCKAGAIKRICRQEKPGICHINQLIITMKSHWFFSNNLFFYFSVQMKYAEESIEKKVSKLTQKMKISEMVGNVLKVHETCRKHEKKVFLCSCGVIVVVIFGSVLTCDGCRKY